jgi:hypothetical protein
MPIAAEEVNCTKGIRIDKTFTDQYSFQAPKLCPDN